MRRFSAASMPGSSQNSSGRHRKPTARVRVLACLGMAAMIAGAIGVVSPWSPANAGSPSTRSSTLAASQARYTLAANQTPVANVGHLYLQQGQSFTGSITILTSDPDGDPLTFTMTDPAHGTLGYLPNGDAQYTAPTDYFGPDDFDFTACDPTDLCATNTMHVNVEHPTEVNPDTATTTIDAPVTINVVANDSDPEAAGPLSLSTLTQPASGGSVAPSGSSVVFTPTTGWAGTTTFTYRACDVRSICATATVTVTVAHPPVAVTDTLHAQNGHSNTLDVLANDTDNDTDIADLRLQAVGSPSHGNVSLNSGDTAVIYTPTAGYTGSDSFTYTVCDPSSLCDTGTVNLTVQQATVAQDDTAITGAGQAVTINVLDNDSDPDGGALSIDTISTPASGTVTRGSGTGELLYTPSPGYSGLDSFTYTACDPDQLCALATVRVTVNPAPQTPVTNNDSSTTTVGQAVTINVLANDNDPDGGALSIATNSTPAHGSASITSGGSAILYTPTAGYSGSDSFTYTACDPSSLCATATVTVTVNPSAPTPPTPPSLANDSATTKAGQLVTINVLANDSDPDGGVLSIASASSPAHGSVRRGGPASLTYTPEAGFAGDDSFTYSACNSADACRTATVSVAVLAPAPPSAPARSTDGDSGQEQSVTLSIPTGGWASLLDENDVPVARFSLANKGVFELNTTTGLLRFSPLKGFSATASVRYLLTDQYGQQAQGTYTATVAAMSTPPSPTPTVVGEAPGDGNSGSGGDEKPNTPTSGLPRTGSDLIPLLGLGSGLLLGGLMVLAAVNRRRRYLIQR